MSYRQIPEGWSPHTNYQDFLSKHAPVSSAGEAAPGDKADRMASIFTLPPELRRMVGDEIIGRQIDPDDGLHRIVDSPPYLYDRHQETAHQPLTTNEQEGDN